MRMAMLKKPLVAFLPFCRAHVLRVRSARQKYCGLSFDSAQDGTGRTLRKDSRHAFLTVIKKSSGILCTPLALLICATHRYMSVCAFPATRTPWSGNQIKSHFRIEAFKHPCETIKGEAF